MKLIRVRAHGNRGGSAYVSVVEEKNGIKSRRQSYEVPQDFLRIVQIVALADNEELLIEGRGLDIELTAEADSEPTPNAAPVEPPPKTSAPPVGSAVSGARSTKEL